MNGSEINHVRSRNTHNCVTLAEINPEHCEIPLPVACIIKVNGADKQINGPVSESLKEARLNLSSSCLRTCNFSVLKAEVLITKRKGHRCVFGNI